MLITRWQAPLLPNIQQIKSMYLADGLKPSELRLEPGQKIKAHPQAFAELFTVVEGQVFVEIVGNRFLLRPGDRTLLASNTKYSVEAHSSLGCFCLYAQKV